MLVIVLRIPVSLEISKANFLRLTAIYLASAVPFFITGLEFSIVFAREAKHVSPLYAADLAGGALACLAIVPLLNWLGGPNTVFFTAACMALAGMVWAVDRKLRRSAAGRAIFILVLIAVNYSGRLFDIVYAKGGFRDSAWVEFARWNAISRVEVDTPGQGQGDRDRCRRLHLPDERRSQALGGTVGAKSDVGAAGAGQRAASAW